MADDDTAVWCWARSAAGGMIKVKPRAGTAKLADGVRLHRVTGKYTWRGICRYAASSKNNEIAGRIVEHMSGRAETQLLWHPELPTRILLDFPLAPENDPLWSTFVNLNRNLLRAGLHHPVEDCSAAVFPEVTPNDAAAVGPAEQRVVVVSDRAWGRLSVQVPARPVRRLLSETYGLVPLPDYVPVLEVLDARHTALRRGSIVGWRDTCQMLGCVAEGLSVVIGASAIVVRSMPQYLANHQQAVVLASMLGECLISAPSFPPSRAGRLYPGQGPMTPDEFECCWQPNDASWKCVATPRSTMQSPTNCGTVSNYSCLRSNASYFARLATRAKTPLNRLTCVLASVVQVSPSICPRAGGNPRQVDIHAISHTR